ncbi:hypothetical protein ACFO5K_10805 [Nocardia halotolerans]|uniref:Uncharacterized protein n=1 Tax=Nocardia halotolerans TaxID=1755878 RepID=A0ABV8VEX6_9NOCA
MNQAEHDESIGSMLAGIASALRDVSEKLDVVAARVQQEVPTFPVDEDVPDQIRIRRLESWAFHASQDIARLSSRLDALDGSDPEPSGQRPTRGSRSRREVREAAERADAAREESEPPAAQNRPPLERRQSPTRSVPDHLGDPTWPITATPVPRTTFEPPSSGIDTPGDGANGESTAERTTDAVTAASMVGIPVGRADAAGSVSLDISGSAGQRKVPTAGGPVNGSTGGAHETSATRRSSSTHESTDPVGRKMPAVNGNGTVPGTDDADRPRTAEIGGTLVRGGTATNGAGTPGRAEISGRRHVSGDAGRDRQERGREAAPAHRSDAEPGGAGTHLPSGTQRADSAALPVSSGGGTDPRGAHSANGRPAHNGELNGSVARYSDAPPARPVRETAGEHGETNGSVAGRGDTPAVRHGRDTADGHNEINRPAAQQSDAPPVRHGHNTAEGHDETHRPPARQSDASGGRQGHESADVSDSFAGRGSTVRQGGETVGEIGEEAGADRSTGRLAGGASGSPVPQRLSGHVDDVPSGFRVSSGRRFSTPDAPIDDAVVEARVERAAASAPDRIEPGGRADIDDDVRDGDPVHRDTDVRAGAHPTVHEPTSHRAPDHADPAADRESGIERARPVGKPTEIAGQAETRGVSSDAMADARSGLTDGEHVRSRTNGHAVNGFADQADSGTDAPVGGSTNGIHWAFAEDPASTPAPPVRNGRPGNGFTNDSAHRAEVFHDFTPRDRLTTDFAADTTPPAPPTRLSPPKNQAPPPSSTTPPATEYVSPGSTPMNSAPQTAPFSAGFASAPQEQSTPADPAPDSAAHSAHADTTGPATYGQPANDYRGFDTPGHGARADIGEPTNNHHRSGHEASGPPTVDLPTGRGSTAPESTPSTSTPWPAGPDSEGRAAEHRATPQAQPPVHERPTSLPASGPISSERAVSDPAPPTATDAAGITVTGTYRAIDMESAAHVDQLQAMLDELKRSAGLPPGRRDVFGPPTRDAD